MVSKAAEGKRTGRLVSLNAKAMSTGNKKPTNDEFKGDDKKGNSNLKPQADKDQSANQKSVDDSHTPMGKDFRNMQDGDTKVQNPNRNLAQGGNNTPNRKQ